MPAPAGGGRWLPGTPLRCPQPGSPPVLHHPLPSPPPPTPSKTLSHFPSANLAPERRSSGLLSPMAFISARMRQLHPGSTPSPPAHGDGVWVAAPSPPSPVNTCKERLLGGCGRHRVPPGRKDGRGRMQGWGSGGPWPPSPKQGGEREVFWGHRAAQPPPMQSKGVQTTPRSMWHPENPFPPRASQPRPPQRFTQPG